MPHRRRNVVPPVRVFREVTTAADNPLTTTLNCRRVYAIRRARAVARARIFACTRIAGKPDGGARQSRALIGLVGIIGRARELVEVGSRFNRPSDES